MGPPIFRGGRAETGRSGVAAYVAIVKMMPVSLADRVSAFVTKCKQAGVDPARIYGDLTTRPN
jgi:hypothetical protein